MKRIELDTIVPLTLAAAALTLITLAWILL
jgi:hypothetical protein